MTQTSNPWPVVVGGIGVGGVGAGTLGGVVGGVPGGPEGRPLEANPPNVGSFVLGSTNFFGQSGLSGPRVNFTGPEFIVDGQSGRLPPKEQVREVWINPDPFTTEYSRPGFGRIHVNPFSTERPLHGSAVLIFGMKVFEWARSQIPIRHSLVVVNSFSRFPRTAPRPVI